jgi:hypothetical protein
LGARAFFTTFLVVAAFADFPVFLADGLAGALDLALAGRRDAAAFFAEIFLPAGAFFLAAAFFADMAVASKTVRNEAAIIQTAGGRGRGNFSSVARR